MLRIFSIITSLFLSVEGFASETAHHEGGVPWVLIQKQSFNFLLVLGLLVYLLRSKIRDYYTARVETFEKLAILAKQAKQDAENQKREMIARLEALESSAAASIARARKEAEDMRVKIENEAKALAKQLREDASTTTNREIERAKHELQDEVLSLAMTQAREHLKTSVKEPEQKRLQNEFVDKIQVVR